MVNTHQDEVLKRAVDVFGAELQAVVFMEEMAELTQELSKFVRGKDNKDAIIEETADVILMTAQLPFMLGADVKEFLGELQQVVAYKVERLAKRIEQFEREASEE